MRKAIDPKSMKADPKSMKAYLGKSEARLNHWGAKLDLLATRADTVESALSRDFQKHIDALILKHQAARIKLDELRAANAEGFESFRTGLDAYWNELEGTLKELTARFEDALSEKKQGSS